MLEIINADKSFSHLHFVFVIFFRTIAAGAVFFFFITNKSVRVFGFLHRFSEIFGLDMLLLAFSEILDSQG